MTRRKRVLLVVIGFLLLSQAPFAYRRYKLGKLHANIQTVNSQRSFAARADGFTEYKGVVHVHSFLGGHSRGTFEEIIAAAKVNHLNFVVMTEHPSGTVDTSAMTLRGDHNGVLFINGNEVSVGNDERLLIVPGFDPRSATSIGEVVSRANNSNSLKFVAYPEEFNSWDAGAFDGIEIYNVFTNTSDINPVVMFFDGLWSYRSYPELLFASFYQRPATNLQKWDHLTSSGRKLTAIAGNDAHANVGVNFRNASGKSLVGIQLDPYERSFQLVRVHVLIPNGQALTSETLLAALKSGHAFIAFDLFGDSAGFSFSATNGNETKIQGDEITLNDQLKLTVSSPVSCRSVLIKDGNVLHDDQNVTSKQYQVTEKGVYRVEFYLPQLGDRVGREPWILSNPIYVK